MLLLLINFCLKSIWKILHILWVCVCVCVGGWWVCGGGVWGVCLCAKSCLGGFSQRIKIILISISQFHLFETIFGVSGWQICNIYFLCVKHVKHYLYLCEFLDKIPNFTNFKEEFLSRIIDMSIMMQKNRGKLSFHHKNCIFDILFL